jgi:hypothetical protein
MIVTNTLNGSAYSVCTCEGRGWSQQCLYKCWRDELGYQQILSSDNPGRGIHTNDPLLSPTLSTGTANMSLWSNYWDQVFFVDRKA